VVVQSVHCRQAVEVAFAALAGFVYAWWHWSAGQGQPGIDLDPALLLVAVVLAPVCEEYIFRGWLQVRLGQLPFVAYGWRGWTLANLCTSMVFSLAHLPFHGLSQLWGYFLVSLVFGRMRDVTGTVTVPILLHAYYNLIALTT
jgi:membrane protease YdiL (CAAX protease family)